ncbi:hypothetical protein SPWS13_0834 [Shewanella putrefaciens]|nr:hypothetical protein SPWS13_0834 [Shewanella putrefaciens]
MRLFFMPLLPPSLHLISHIPSPLQVQQLRLQLFVIVLFDIF